MRREKRRASLNNNQNMNTQNQQDGAALAPVVGSAPFFLFAAHAPEIPTWFKRMEWQEEVVEPTNDGRPGWVHKVVKTRMEEPMAHLVRWRMAYAAAMVSALPNTKVTHDPLGGRCV